MPKDLLEMHPLSIGILSWRAPLTLEHTLESYAEAGLLNLAAQKFILLQEVADKERSIAERYNLEIYTSSKNLGIANGYKYMVDQITQPYYLFLENDWVINNTEIVFVKTRLDQGLYLLDDGIDFIKYRSRQYPGSPLWARQWFGRELQSPEHILDSIHWRTDDSIGKNFSKYLTKTENGWYITTSKYANWTNNPHLIKTQFVKEDIKPMAGRHDIEQDIQRWWRNKEFKVAQGDGLFTHKRLDR